MSVFQSPGRSTVFAGEAAAATSHPLATAIALDLLKDGGNAVDAAIGAAAAIGLFEPAMTGLGGDCFVMVKPAGSEEIIGLNGSGRAPAALDAADLRAQGLTAVDEGSAHAVTVPGAVDAFARLARDHGRLDLATCLAPAIRYAEEGAPVAPRAAHDWAMSADHLKGDARRHFLIDDKPLRPGQRFRAPGQAEVLRLIAARGRAGFYEGPVAEDLVASLNALGGLHTLDDLAATSCDYVDVISAPYRGVELCEMPPNGQGATALLMAKILSRFDAGALGPRSAERVHLEAEIGKLAYDARDRFIADPDHMGDRLAELLSDETADALAALVDPARARATVAEATAPLYRTAHHKDTIYLTVVDRDRMVVSLIYSIFHSFGSGLATARYGIPLQNRGAGFTLEEGHPNELKGGKRPFHTIIPAMARRDGKVWASFGVMGGQFQAAGHTALLSNLVDHGMDVQSAIDAPRAFADGGSLALETGYGEEIAASLAALGHRIERREVGLGGAQAILIDPETGDLSAGSDPRKDGLALGR